MGTRAPWGIAALLGIACLAEADYIVVHRAAASGPPGVAAEIDRTRRRLEEGLGGPERSLFGSSFHDWYSRRMDLAGITTKVASQGKDVTVTFGFPASTSSVKFDVNANRIRFRYEARKDVKKGGSDVETAESLEKVLPLPAGADPNGFEVRKGKDQVGLVFHKIERAG